MEFQLINDGFSADFIDGFWNDIVMVFGLTNTAIYPFLSLNQLLRTEELYFLRKLIKLVARKNILMNL